MFETDTFWALVGLVLFLLILLYYKVPGMITRALDDRTGRIRTELDEARQMREEAQGLLAEYQRKRREAEAEAAAIVEEARRDAQRMTAEAQENLREMVERRTRSAEEKIEQAEAQAIADVRARAADLAVAAATDVLQKKIKGDVADRIVSESIQVVRERLH